MSQRPPIGCSVPNMVQRYLGTEYDTVKLIADNIEALLKLVTYAEAGADIIPVVLAPGQSVYTNFAGGGNFATCTCVFIG